MPNERQLKAWDSPAWKRPLSRTLTVSRIDEDIPTEEQTAQRKPWLIALTRDPTHAERDVEGLPPGHSLVLSTNEVLALVHYLMEPQIAVWASQLHFEEPGECQAVMYEEPGMVILEADADDADATVVTVIEGEAHWSPDYFRQAEPLDPEDLSTGKIHTLPWLLPDDVLPSRTTE
jgi:hypothetical protein